MKKCKFLSVLLALVLALSLVSGALAEDAAPEEVTAVDRDTVWSYYDNEKDPLVGTEYEKWNIRTLWARGIFLDSPDWKQAKGSFGAKNGSSTDLGDGFVANTLLNQYKEDGDGIECYFFVTTFQVEDLSRVKQIMGSLYYDDCAVVYLNQNKVAAFDEPEGGFSKNMEYGGSNASDPKLGEFTVTDMNLLQEGTNVLAVELHQGRASSSDIYLDFQSLVLSSQEVDYSQMPLEQDTIALNLGADETQMSISWYASTDTPGMVAYAPEPAVQNGSLPADAATVTASVSPTTRGGYWSHQLTLTGLEPDTTYVYQLTNHKNEETCTSEIATFTTGGGEQTSFLFVGDPQLGSSGNLDSDDGGWENTLNLASQHFPDATFLLSAGDQVDTASNETHYQAYLNHGVLRSLPQATTIGNHDSSSDAYSKHFQSANESTLGATKAGGDSYFVYNGILFLVLNSNNLSTAEHKAFMENAIAATAEQDIRWKIVVFHHSVYSVASHAVDDDILSRRDTLVPLFQELDIDVVLMGHDHVYTRSYMMDGLTPMTDASIYDSENYDSITDPEGILYVTANSGSGSKFYNISGTYPYAAVQNQEKVPNVSHVTVSDTEFTITTYRTSDMSQVDTFTIYKTPEIVNPFQDVRDTDWFYQDVMHVYEAGLMQGVSDHVFAPNTGTTRAMAVTMLYRLAGEPAVKTTASFQDVDAGCYYAKAVAWAEANGITEGIDDTHFAPNGTVTRQQLALFLYRYARFQGYDTTARGDLAAYPDRPAVWARSAMQWCVGAGIIEGLEDGTLRPNGTATRAQIAAVFHRFLTAYQV